MNNKKTVWSTRYTDTVQAREAVSSIAKLNNISEISASLLYNRGFHTAEDASRFLNFNDVVMHSPLLLKDVEKAVARISEALENNERIAIFGDYDVDGVTSVTMLYLYLHNLGADIGYYIPNRIGEGYGLSREAINLLHNKGVSLIITVDTGITAVDETEYAKSLGIDIVITDHHECQEIIPDAAAVVNPHQSDCQYPFKSLAGVGVIFKVICAFEIINFGDRNNEAEAVKSIYYRFADLAAIGTIADVMPIIDENRIIVKFGLEMITKTKRIGLLALMEAASLGSNPNVRAVVPDNKPKAEKQRKINSTYIGFTIAPRINAAGRISSASKAVELLLADDVDTAWELAYELCEINYQRQVEENKIADEAYKNIENELDLNSQNVIVIEDDEWLQGVVGIVSSKVTEKYGLPSILISFDGAANGVQSGLDLGKGSGRSIKGFNLVDALSHSKDTLVKYGGHELAAGLTVRRKDVDAFRTKINEYANQILTEEDLCYTIEADREINISSATLDLAKELSILEPFGNMNPTPNFIMRNLKVLRAYLIGGGNHTKFVLEQNGLTINAVMFHRSYLALNIKENDVIDVLFTLEVNKFNNTESVQMILQDVKLSDDYISYFKDETALYQSFNMGEAIDADDIIPTREDFVTVYTLLRKEFRIGNDMMTETEIYHMLSAQKSPHIRLAKLKIILDILNELKICTVREVSPGIYQYDIYFNSEKTNIEKSSILKKLKNQCIRK
jgi:single-stranded-DNA-specific exonuclease